MCITSIYLIAMHSHSAFCVSRDTFRALSAKIREKHRYRSCRKHHYICNERCSCSLHSMPINKGRSDVILDFVFLLARK